MRRLLIVGAVSLASALAASCGDDSGDGGGGAGTGGNGGSGGSAGNGGSAGGSGASGASGNAGNGGSAGGSGAGGSAGTSGAAGSSAGSSGAAGSGTVDPDAGGDASTADAGDGGGPPPCTGCVELRVPFTAINQAAFFQIGFTTRSLADTVATFRVRAEVLDETGQTYVHAFATDNSDFTQASAAQTLINAANFTDTNTFIDVVLDFTNFSNVDFDEADVIALGLQVGSNGGLAGPLTSVLLVDSLTLTGTSGLANLTFTASAEGLAPNAFAGLQTTTLIHHPE